MTISITSSTQVVHTDTLERNILRFETVVNIDGDDYILDVYLNRDNDDAVEFEYPEDLDLSDEDQDEIFTEVVQAIHSCSDHRIVRDAQEREALRLFSEATPAERAEIFELESVGAASQKPNGIRYVIDDWQVLLTDEASVAAFLKGH